MVNGVCVFCENDGKLSGEHLWPNWLNDELLDAAKETDHFLKTVDKEATWRNGMFTTTRNIVCEPCNNNWMSDIEGVVKPLLMPLLGGKSFRLGRERQTVLARWATKTALTHGALRTTNRIPPKDAYSLFYRSKAPLPDSQIWIGVRWIPGAEPPGIYADVAPLRWANRFGEVVPRPSAFSATLGLGPLAMQVFGGVEKVVPVPGVAAKVRQIWPPSARFSWPIREGLTEDEFRVPQRTFQLDPMQPRL